MLKARVGARRPGNRLMRSYRKALLFMMIPGLIYYIVYKYLPMYGVLIAFKDFRIKAGILGSPWADPLFKHFTYFFQSPYCMQVLGNTLFLSLFKILANTLSCMGLAILLSEVRVPWFKRTVQTITYLPHFLSWVIVYGILYALLSESSGLVNVLLRAAGRETAPILTNDAVFRWLLVLSDVWKDSGWGAIIYLAAIAGIDPALYESAQIDGAGRLRRIWHITLSGIRPTIVIVLILRMGSVMDTGFDQVYNLYNVQVYSVADIIDTWVYRTGLEQMNFSLATAVGLFKSAISMALLVSVNAVARRWEESLW